MESIAELSVLSVEVPAKYNLITTNNVNRPALLVIIPTLTLP